MIKIEKFLILIFVSLFLNINCSDEKLIEAAKAGNLDEVKLQLDQGADIEAHDSEGYTSLMHAAHEGRLGVARLLLERKAKPTTTYTYSEKSSHIALLCASTRLTPEHHEIATLLLENGADVNQVNCYNNTALMWAAYTGNVKLVQMLLERGAKVNVEDKYKKTAISYAFRKDVGEILFRHGENINHIDYKGSTPLNRAVLDGDEELIRFLLENGADVNSTGGYAPLISAVEYYERHKNNLKILLEYGVDINHIHSDGYTALGIAIDAGNVEGATLLLEHGANPNIGHLPLTCAAHQGNTELVLLLLKYNASIDLQDAKKRTPLMHATAYGHEETVAILLEHGANTTIRDKEDKIALDYVNLDYVNNDEIRQLLIDYDNSHKQNEKSE